MPGKAIAMISGGLDSTLAVALVRRQGIEVKAINFYTGLCITETQRRKGGRPDGTIPENEALRAAAQLEVDVEYVDISGSGYFDMLVQPRWGYGANANPCVDCRVFMMRKAREIMLAEGADFVLTGEVLCVVATDPGIQTDMPMWCMATRNEHVGTFRDGACFRSWVRKRR